MRRWTVAIYIKFSQRKRSRFWREERLPNHSGRASINLCIHTVLSAVKRWISSGRDLSLSQPYKNSFLRDACKCWTETGKASSSSQNPPISKDFKQVRQSNSSGRWVKFWQHIILNLVRECSCRRFGIDFKLGQ